MDKAVIFDAFEFVGFHFCKKLLDIGFEVSGIQFNHEKKNKYLDEMRLEVGRNANFKEKTMEEWATQMEKEMDDPAFFIFSLYDLYMGYKEDLLNNEILKDYLLNSIRQRNKQSLIVFLLPIQLISEENDAEGLRGCKDFLKSVDEMECDSQFFYLPSLYGPWQSDAFFFQKAMLNNLNEREESKEWMGDTIFIRDAIELVIEQMEDKTPGKYLLESGKQNRWFECAEFLNIDETYFRKNVKNLVINDEFVLSLKVGSPTSIPDSFAEQKEHLNYLSTI
ncbi:MAG: hypothetical protein Q8934_10970 [Bacillota bacterium]|nr:hypothetical protein [Bacillota bacterium]